jgi:hypothetical protein
MSPTDGDSTKALPMTDASDLRSHIDEIKEIMADLEPFIQDSKKAKATYLECQRWIKLLTEMHKIEADLDLSECLLRLRRNRVP